MGLSFGLIGFPLITLMIATVLTGAGGITGNGNVSLGQASAGTTFTVTGCNLSFGNTYFCTGWNPVQGINLGGGIITVNYLTTSDGCLGANAPATSCNTVISVQNAAGGTNTLASCNLQSGGNSFACTLTQATNQGGTTFQMNFGGVTLGSGFFIAFIGIAITAVCLIGIQVLGSGIGTESIHILFVAGVPLGIWLTFSAAEGFLTGSTSSFFSQLNAANSNLALGTLSYLSLTLVYLVGTVGLVSRGNA